MALFGKRKKAKPKTKPTLKTEATKVKPENDSMTDVSKATSGSKAKSAPKKTTKKEKVEKVESRIDKKPFHVSKRKGRRQTARQNMATALSQVLLRPRITEKATDVTANRTYVFEIAVEATKRDVVKAVEHYYKVTPIKVNVVKIPTRKRRNRNQRTFGTSSIGKKAYVFLKEGDSIEFV